MDINCPYCGTHYELDDSLLPEGDIKVKCRICSNVFILNKNSGAFKDEPHISAETQKPATQTTAETAHLFSQTADSAPASSNSPESSEHSSVDDFMRSIISEINSSVTAEGTGGKHKKDSDSGSVQATLSSPSPSLSGGKNKGKTSPFQIIMLIILAVLFLIAAASALVHYKIINIPFLPSGVSDLLSSF